MKHKGIDKPISLRIDLTYSQAIAIKNQLAYKIQKLKLESNEVSTFQKFKRKNETKK